MPARTFQAGAGIAGHALHMPAGGFLERLALRFAVVAHGCSSKASSRQRSVVLYMYFFTELSETPSAVAISP